MARDCPVNRDPTAAMQQPMDTPGALIKGGFDSEYANLMAELGEGGKAPGDAGKTPWMASAGHDITAGGSNIPPWRRPEMWQSTTPGAPQQPQQQGYRPPQPGYESYGGVPGGAYGAANAQWGMQQQQQQQGQQQYPQQAQDYGNYAQYYQNQYSQQQPTPAH